MSEMKKKEQVFRIMKLTHDSQPDTFMVQKRSFGASALFDLLTVGSVWENVVEADSMLEAECLLTSKYHTYKQEFSGRVVAEEQVWP